MTQTTPGQRATTGAAALCELAAVAVAAFGLASCAVGPDFKAPAPPDAADYGAASSSEPTASAPGAGGDAQRFTPSAGIAADWWTLFESPELTALVESALEANPDVAAAKANLRQAQELAKAQQGAFLPTVAAGFSATRSRFPQQTLTPPTNAAGSNYNLYTAQLTVSYVPDIFGGTRRAVEAARAQADSSRYQLAAARVTVSSTVVVTAIQEASLRDQIDASERLLELQHRLTEMLESQRSIGTASELDVQAQRAAEAQTAAILPLLNKQLGQTRDALTALLGRLPAAEPAERLRLADLALPRELPVSLPANLVRQRPDVLQAQANLQLASAQAGIALADLLPQFAISADTGSSALRLRDLFTPYTGFWDVGASLTQILFDSGALLHRHRAADAALDQAAAQYRSAVILACQNVADTLRALRADADALRASAAALEASKASLQLARQQRELGTISGVTLIAAEQSQEQAEVAVAQARANRYADTAALFQSLGGGWWNRPGDIQ